MVEEQLEPADQRVTRLGQVAGKLPVEADPVRASVHLGQRDRYIPFSVAEPKLGSGSSSSYCHIL